MFDRKKRPDSSVSGSRLGFTIGHESGNHAPGKSGRAAENNCRVREEASPSFSYFTNGNGTLKAAGARNLTKSMLGVDELFSTAQAIKK